MVENAYAAHAKKKQKSDAKKAQRTEEIYSTMMKVGADGRMIKVDADDKYGGTFSSMMKVDAADEYSGIVTVDHRTAETAEADTATVGQNLERLEHYAKIQKAVRFDRHVEAGSKPYYHRRL